MMNTKFYEDFLFYYRKAQVLQCKNLLIVDQESTVSDPLMDNITIYDTVNRRQAGFSKALEDIHGVRQRKDLIRYPNHEGELDAMTFHFLHLFHRFTGSGASFEPRLLKDGSLNPREHGYCNNKVNDLANLRYIDQMNEFIVKCTVPMITSKGNQPPSIKNGDPAKYRLAQQYYFDNFAKQFIYDYMTFLINHEYEHDKSVGIKAAVDFCCAWHKERGFKQWKFVLTAFVMDTAEYYPDFVDPSSHCYYGANCIRGFDLCFEKEKTDPRNKAEFYELCMARTCEAVGGKPYDVEDVFCDYIRYLKEYIPKGYEHLTPEQRLNNSLLKINGRYPDDIQKRIDEVLS